MTFTFSQPGRGALHRTTVLFYCAGKVLSEGTAAHTTQGPGKDLGMMETMILSLCPVLFGCHQESTLISRKLLLEHK